jgi:integrase
MLFRQQYRDRKTGEPRRSRYWSYEFSFGGARIREKTGLTSKTAAKEAERARRQRLAEGSSGLRRVKPRLFRQAADEWLGLKRGSLAPSSLRIEGTNLSHLLPVFGNVLACDVEAGDVGRYQEQRKEEGAAAATVNLEVATLRAVLRRSGLWARLQPDVRMLPAREDVGRALSPDEESRLLTAASESRSRSLAPALVLALNTGLRRGELASLRWAQVDLEARRITVGKSKTRAGSGRKVPLNERAFSAFSAWARRFPFRRAEHHVFPSEKYGQGGAVYETEPEESIGTFKEGWEAAKKRARVSCRWHDLRHTFCTRLLEGGTAFPIVAAIMGWSAATTVRMAQRYGHLSADTLSAAVAVLDSPKTARI